ncbi:AAA family ATPase [Rhodohalobacter halophilus]|uniref:AAA family ATPase n=1 Tax=Rhodohalobacter halophilus TaxID=1812810 RepID=UPI00083FB70F|nr:MoxR family ATPase [Rhodohalobacter halophilus]
MSSLQSEEPEVIADTFSQSFSDIKREISKVVVGQADVVDQLLISLFSGGHCVLVGVPGLAKTLLIHTVAETLNLSFSRIQFTPDLMPGDITGTEVIEDDKETGKKHFKFIQGPIFANIVLADEINRTPPKTQAALLEGMQEHKVTASGQTFKLDDPFFVLATQNPIEQEGTYPLPEAQLDRFMFQIHLNYPNPDEEKQIVKQTTSARKAEVNAVLEKEQILEFQKLIREVPVPEHVLDQTIKLVTQTRPNTEISKEWVNSYLSWGAGPRASQYLILGAKTRALSQGRMNVEIQDIEALAVPVLRHRIVTNYAAEADGFTTEGVILKLLKEL